MKIPSKTASGVEIQRALDKYATDVGQTYSVNSSTFSTKGKRGPKAATTAAVPDYFTYLSIDECRKEIPVARYLDYMGRLYNHYQWCAWEDRQASFHDPNDASKILGSIDYRLTILGWGDSTGTNVQLDVYVDDVRNPKNGMTADNTWLEFSPECDASGGCTPASSIRERLSSLSDGQPRTLVYPVGLVTKTDDNVERRTVANIRLAIQATTAAPNAQSGTSESYNLEQAVRCDLASEPYPDSFSNATCIFSGVSPLWTLSLSDDEVGEVAEHVHWALTDPDSTTPEAQPGYHKFIPDILHREMDKLKQAKNRQISTDTCDKLLQNPRPPGKECDEYPPAASKEGAAEGDYSVALLDGDQNAEEGRRRGVWLRADRILNSDEYQVVIIP